MLRSPAVAGKFYAGDRDRLKKQVGQYLTSAGHTTEAVGIMVPHAGLIYSGSVAGMVYSGIAMPKTFVMLGPNHTGLGAPVSVMDDGEWEVPTGRVRIDRKLAVKILQNTQLASRDSQAHAFEHSLEVQLPFITCLSSDISIVPVAIMSATYDDCLKLAEAVVAAIRSVDYPVTILASSDMSHFLSDKAARHKDQMALDMILRLDPKGLYDIVKQKRITMCGVLPATVMIIASMALGAGSAKLLRYMTSGEVSGDYDSVVGYAGVVLSR